MTEAETQSGGGMRALGIAAGVTLAAVVAWGIGWVIMYMLMLWLTPG